MTLEFAPLNRKELRQAAELAARAFCDYEYFTNWFPDPEERARVEIAVIWHAYKTNFSRAHYFTAKLDGKIVATAELNAPDYKEPSVLSYILHGWLNVYRAANIKRVNDWIAMDAAAGQPSHDYQKTGPGDDHIGRFFVETCTEKGITPYLATLSEQSGIAYTFISPNGERTFATYLGAAAMMAPENIDATMFEGYDYLYVEGYLVQNHALILRAVELAKLKGLKICLDLASYNVVEADKEFFKLLLTEYVDIVFANEEEARAFTGLAPEKALEQLHELCEIAVVKLGAGGSMLMHKGDKVYVEAMPVQEVLDTTAAGDFYAAGVLYGLLHGCGLHQCAEMGSLLAGYVIQTLGTKLDAAVWEEIRHKVSRVIDAQS